MPGRTRAGLHRCSLGSLDHGAIERGHAVPQYAPFPREREAQGRFGPAETVPVEAMYIYITKPNHPEMNAQLRRENFFGKEVQARKYWPPRFAFLYAW